MKKIISLTGNLTILTSTSPQLDTKSRIEKAIIQFEQANSSFILFADGKKVIDPSKIEAYNLKFKGENADLILELQKLENSSVVFAKELGKLRAVNSRLKILTESDIYLLALKSLNQNFEGKSVNNATTVDLSYPRIGAARKNDNFRFDIATKAEAEAVFKDKLISLADAEALYGLTRTAPKQEGVFAGGAATRYKKVLHALKGIKVSDDNAVLDETILKSLRDNKEYSDIKDSFSPKKIGDILNTPMFHGAGFTDVNFRKDEHGHYNIKDIQKAVSSVMTQFNGILKALDYGYEVDLDGKKVQVNYFLNKYLSNYSDLKEKGIKGSTLYFQLDTKKNIAAFQKMVDLLKAGGIIDPSILDVKFMDEKQSPVVSMKTGHLILENGDLKTQPTGHGPAFMAVGNTVLHDKKGAPVPFSVQTIDNSGTELAKYTTLTHNACEFENKVRDELVLALKQDDKDALLAILSNPKYAFNLSKFDLSKPLPELAAQVINLRWDYKVDISKDIASQIENLPITVPVVAEIEPGVVPTGGGLHVNKDTKQMAIVDKLNMTPDQSKNGDFKMYFNPMLFTTLVKKPMTGDMESGTIFVAEKGTTEKFLKGESASTHIATDPSRVLKRVITVPFNKKSTVIVEHKSLAESTIGSNKAPAQKLEKYLKAIAVEKGLSITQLVDSLKMAQAAGIQAIVGGKKVEAKQSDVQLPDQLKKILPQQHLNKLKLNPTVVTQRIIPTEHGSMQIKEKMIDGGMGDVGFFSYKEVTVTNITKA